jgi:hypothetical protein
VPRSNNAAIVTEPPKEDGGQRANGTGGAGDQPPEQAADGDPRWEGEGAAPAEDKVAQEALLRRILLIEPGTVWERDFLRRIANMVRGGQSLAPGELAKIYELEAHAAAAQPPREK